MGKIISVIIVLVFSTNMSLGDIVSLRETTNNKFCPLIPHADIIKTYDEFIEYPIVEFVFDKNSRREVLIQIFRFYSALSDSLPRLSPKEEEWLEKEFDAGGDS